MGRAMANLLSFFRPTERRAKAPERVRAQAALPGRGRSPFIAASSDRLTASWQAGRQSINDELRSDLDRLRDRAREMSRNNGYARRFLKMVARNVVGPSGFILQARVMDAPDRPDSLANQAVELAFWEWSKRGSCDVTGRLSFADACRAAIRAVARDGEALVREVRGPDAGNATGYALQLIDVARLDTDRNRQASSGQNAILMGVEINSYQRPVAYWIKPSPTASTSAAVRYPAADIHHIFMADMAEQVRGIPWMHAAMIDLHDLGEFNRSALLAARKGADTLGFIIEPELRDDLTGEVDDTGTEIEVSEMGQFSMIPHGADVKQFDSKYPNETFEPFTKAILRRVASGFDVAYNALANDLEGVNFSSIRAGTIEERDEWILIQKWFIEALLEPVYTSWFQHAMLAGTIRMPNGSALPITKRDKFFAHEWQGRRWQWVDPMKDIQAARLGIQTGITSPQIVAAQNGMDVEDVITSIAAFEAMVAAKGVQSVQIADKAVAARTPSPPLDGEPPEPAD